jgi:hypothetical protein
VSLFEEGQRWVNTRGRVVEIVAADGSVPVSGKTVPMIAYRFEGSENVFIRCVDHPQGWTLCE